MYILQEISSHSKELSVHPPQMMEGNFRQLVASFAVWMPKFDLTAVDLWQEKLHWYMSFLSPVVSPCQYRSSKVRIQTHLSAIKSAIIYNANIDNFSK